MSAELSAVLALLAHLSYDELTDFIFLVERSLLRAQQGSTNKTEREQASAQLLQLGRKGIAYERLARRSDELESAQRLMEKLEPGDQRTAVELAKTLRTALQPVERRRKRRDKNTGRVEDVAKGRVEVKYIRIPVYDPETGLRAVDENGNKLSRGPGPTIGPPKEIPGFGPYLYVRSWATGGGRLRNLKKLKSKYVGLKGLATHLEQILETHLEGSPERKRLAEEIIDRYHDGTLRQWASEHYPDPGKDEEITEDYFHNEMLSPASDAPAPLTQAELPFADVPLTKARREQLFDFFRDKYQMRHGHPWRFYSGTLVRQPEGKYRLVYKLWADDAAVRFIEYKDRQDMEHSLLWIVNTAGDADMTLDR